MRTRWVDTSGGAALVIAAALVLVVAAVAATAVQGLVQPSIALAFGAFVAVGELIRINLPGDRVAAPLGAAGALGYALLEVFDGVATQYDVLQVVAVVAVGMVVGTVPHVAVGQPPRLDALARRVLTTAFAAAVFRPLYASLGLAGVGTPEWQVPALMLAVVALSGFVDALLAALIRSSRERLPFPAALRDEARAFVGIGSVIGATGVLIALAAEIMGYLALPIFAIPLLIAQFSFRRYAAIRATYTQTIRALSRVTEVGGYTETGHARRVSQLALAVGREMGLSEASLIDLEYGALMHDIGQLSLADPIPGGATVMVAPDEQRRIAGMGAEVIRKTGVLDRVAVIVECQSEPYRRPGQPLDAGIPLSSRIIRACNAYDDRVGGLTDIEAQLAAMEQLRLGMAYDYDPRVVETLSRIVERNSRLGLQP